MGRGAAAEESRADWYLSNTDPATDSARAEGIRLALREFGYIEEQNIAVEYRYAEGRIVVHKSDQHGADRCLFCIRDTPVRSPSTMAKPLLSQSSFEEEVI
jgi:hypothetical protein